MSHDYFHSFNFVIRMNGIEIGFQKMSGLEAQIKVETYQKEGQNNTGVLRLERGTVLFQSGLLYLPGEGIPLITMEVINPKTKEICKTYTIANAIVQKWEINNLNAQENQLLVDIFEVSYEQIRVS